MKENCDDDDDDERRFNCTEGLEKLWLKLAIISMNRLTHLF
jgi:hypothetical protein